MSDEDRKPHPLQQTLPIASLLPPAPLWPRDAHHYEQWARRTDPALFARYIVDAVMCLAREFSQWADKNRPKTGWACKENAPGFDPEAFVIESMTSSANVVALLASDAQQVWKDESHAPR